VAFGLRSVGLECRGLALEERRDTVIFLAAQYRTRAPSRDRGEREEGMRGSDAGRGARRRALGMIVAAVTGGCASVDRDALEVSLIGLSLAEAALLEQRFLLRVRLLNPSGEDRRIEGAGIELQVNGQPFARGVSDRVLVVPRFGEAQAEWTVTGSTAGVLRQMMEIAGGRRRIDYRLRVRARSGDTWLPLEGRGELTLPALAP